MCPVAWARLTPGEGWVGAGPEVILACGLAHTSGKLTRTRRGRSEPVSEPRRGPGPDTAV